MKQLQVKNLSSYYSRDVHALKNISFQLNEGQALGIVGESGSGKSTLAKVLLGLHSIHHGRLSSTVSLVHQKANTCDFIVKMYK